MAGVKRLVDKKGLRSRLTTQNTKSFGKLSWKGKGGVPGSSLQDKALQFDV